MLAVPTPFTPTYDKTVGLGQLKERTLLAWSLKVEYIKNGVATDSNHPQHQPTLLEHHHQQHQTYPASTSPALSRTP
eukprot:12293847-Prorocentrum_lima.AAC.1